MKSIWQKISFIGVNEDNQKTQIEIVFLNRIISISILLQILTVPFDLYLNGTKFVFLGIGNILLFSVILILNHYKLFLFAKFSTFFIFLSFVVLLSFNDKGPNFEFSLILLFVLVFILFKNRYLFIFLASIVALTYILLHEASLRSVTTTDKATITFTLVYDFIILIAFYFEIYYFKVLNKRNEQIIIDKSLQVEIKNREIIDSLNYATKLQKAYLPPKEILNSIFPNSFIMYEPKEIVSGDFYWFFQSKHKNDTSEFDELFVVSADCTGHGIPGALMSIICTNALNSVIINDGETNTGRILDKVREIIISVFNEDNLIEKRKDGMDVSICRIYEQRKVQFSGANNPIWLLRDNADEIEVIKGDRQPVGSYEKPFPFTTHNLELNKNDALFLFSDGYQDQFGGEEGKKFKSINVKRLLLSMKGQNMYVLHKHLEVELHAWKNGREQVDDILFLGIRF